MFIVIINLILFFMKFGKKVAVLVGVLFSIVPGLAYTDDLYESFPAQFNLASLNGTNGFVTW